MPFPEEFAKQRMAEGKPPEAAPLIYNVPSFTSIIHGRDRELFQMWQRLLNGKRIHIITGVDGMGKTGFTAAFAEHAKRSNRFSCVQWFNGHEDVVTQVREFLPTVNGRNEKHVLLIFDQVEDVSSIVALIPPSLDFYAVINCAGDSGYRPYDACFAGGKPYETPKDQTFLKASVKQKAEMAPHTTSFQLGSIDLQHAVACLEERCEALAGPAAELTLKPLAERLGCVPLLLDLGAALLSSGAQLGTSQRADSVSNIEGLIAYLDEKAPVGAEQSLSVKSTAEALVEELLRVVSLRQGAVDPLLSTMSLMNTEDINPGLVGALAGDDVERAHEILKDFNRLRIVSSAWDQEETYRAHPLVAKILRNRPGSDIKSAAKALMSVWPRRWKGTSESSALSIVGHTIALKAFAVPADHPVDKPLEGVFDITGGEPDPLLLAFDRAATYLAEVAGKRLDAATALWYCIFQAQMDKDIATIVQSSETGLGERLTRICTDLGKLMYRSADPRCPVVLARAYDLALQVHGRDAAETAMVLVYRARFLNESDENLTLLTNTAQRLTELAASDEDSSSSSSSTVSLEEQQMRREGAFVLLVAAAKMAEALQKAPQATDELWAKMEKAQELLQQTMTRIKERDAPTSSGRRRR